MKNKKFSKCPWDGCDATIRRYLFPWIFMIHEYDATCTVWGCQILPFTGCSVYGFWISSQDGFTIGGTGNKWCAAVTSPWWFLAFTILYQFLDENEVRWASVLFQRAPNLPMKQYLNRPYLLCRTTSAVYICIVDKTSASKDGIHDMKAVNVCQCIVEKRGWIFPRLCRRNEPMILI